LTDTAPLLPFEAEDRDGDAAGILADGVNRAGEVMPTSLSRMVTGAVVCAPRVAPPVGRTGDIQSARILNDVVVNNGDGEGFDSFAVAEGERAIGSDVIGTCEGGLVWRWQNGRRRCHCDRWCG